MRLLHDRAHRIDSKPHALRLKSTGKSCNSKSRDKPCKKEHDKASQERLEKIEKDLADLREKSSQLHVRWQTKRKHITNLRSLKEKIDQTPGGIDEAERQANLEKAARLRYGTLA